MANAVDNEDTPLEHHSRGVEHCYRAPTYSSDTYPRFPQELIDHICKFHRLDPFTLTKCRLVCHAWYHAARWLFWDKQLKLITRENLDDCAHMLLSDGNRPYGKRFESLQIVEDRRKPFSHIWPMRISGYALPRLKTLELHGFDCAATSPHDLCFHFLSYYTSIKHLNLWRCRFRSMAELRRISNALPSLEHLSLRGITLQHPPAPDSVVRYVPSLRNKLKRIHLGPWHSILVLDARFYRPFLLGVCATYSTVTELSLNLRCYSSFSHLHRFLRHFSRLSKLHLMENFSPYVEPASTADMALYTAQAPIPSLLSFFMLDVYVPLASQLLKLMLTPQTCSKLVVLQFQYLRQNGRCIELVPCVTDVLCLAGAGLKKFYWSCFLAHGDSIRDVVPRVTANTSLTELVMDFRPVKPSLPRIQRDLGTLLFDIQSPHLKRLGISIWLSSPSETSEDGNDLEAPVSETDPPRFTSIFHATLSRSVFDHLPTVSGHPPWQPEFTGVSIAVHWDNVLDVGEAQIATMSVIKSHMITLFAPWLDRGVLRLSCGNGPDVGGPVTRNFSLTPVLSEIVGTHASIEELPTRRLAGCEEGARNACESSGTDEEAVPTEEIM